MIKPIKLLFFGIGITFIIYSTASGFRLPCQWNFPRDLKRFNGKIEQSHCTILGLEIGKNSLNDVMQKLGEAKVFRKDFNGVRPAMICYFNNNSPKKETVIFGSGPLGGWEVLTEVTIATDYLVPCYRQECTSINIDKPISTESGIFLGMDKGALINLIGKPTHFADDMVDYHFIGKGQMTKAEMSRIQEKFEQKSDNPYWDITSGFEAYFKGNKLSWFRVYKMKSY